MNRTTAFAVNTAATTLSQLAVLVFGLIIPRIILDAYGSITNGLISSVTQVITYITLVEAGLGGAAIYALYKPLADKDLIKTNTIISTAKSLYNKTGIAFLLALTLSAVLYPVFVEVPEFSSWNITALVFLIGFKGFCDILILGKYSVLLTADQKIYAIAFSNIIYHVSNGLIIAAMALNGFSIVETYLAAALAFITKFLFLFIFISRNYSGLSFNEQPRPTLLKQRWDVFYLQLLGTTQRCVPIVVLTLIATMEIVSVYAIYNMVILGLSGLMSIFANSLFASFGDVIARKEIYTLQKSYDEFEFSYYTLITWIHICTLTLIVPFVLWYTRGISDADYNQPVFGILITINSFLYCLKTPQGMLVISSGLYRETKWRTTTQALIAIIGASSFGILWGLNGVMIGMMLSNIFRCIDLFFYIPRYVTKLPASITLKRVALSCTLVMMAVYPALKYDIFAAPDIESWIKHGFIISITSSVFLATIQYIHEPDVFKRVWKRFKRLSQN